MSVYNIRLYMIMKIIILLDIVIFRYVKVFEKLLLFIYRFIILIYVLFNGIYVL